MQLLHAILVKKIHITKRDLFYTDVKLFVDQAESDGVLDDVATMIGCTRSNLHVVASDKGLVVGRIQFEEDGDPIDCTRMGVGGKAIPPYIDKIENIKSDAEFVLLVEKEAAYMRMAVSGFRENRWIVHPCLALPLSNVTTLPSLVGRSLLSQVSVYHHYCQGAAGCRVENVSCPHYE
jgi:meiotic recombination protein SPO11